jgi:hypothetical protein
MVSARRLEPRGVIDCRIAEAADLCGILELTAAALRHAGAGERLAESRRIMLIVDLADQSVDIRSEPPIEDEAEPPTLMQ